MASKVVNVPIADVDANPFRMLGTYPYVERKLEALQRSYQDVGMWEGVIGRQNGNRIEIAFGHHRVEAARRAGLTSIPIIVRKLSDEDMLKFMGRENLEDYNADFLCMLETWEAAVNFCSARADQRGQPIVMARLLGWTEPSTQREGLSIMNSTARACSAAHALISGGYNSRNDFLDMSVRSARHLVERAQVRMDQVTTVGQKTQRPAAEIKHAKTQIGKAVKETARQIRANQLAPKDVGGRVDLNAYRFVKESGRQSPLFEVFGKALADSIEKMLNGDSASQKLDEVVKAVSVSMMEEDKRIVARLKFELDELGARTQTYGKRLISSESKVAHLKIADQGGDQ